MKVRNHNTYAVLISLFLLAACNIPLLVEKKESKAVLATFSNSSDSLNVANISWQQYFADPYLVALIDTALQNNQELNIVKQEIEINKNEIRARKGEYLPFVGLTGGIGYEKIGKYTWRGGVEENLDFKENEQAVKSNSDFIIGPTASWELDVWRKLRNAKDAAVQRYLAGIEGRNFLVTNLIAEIANSYYELIALDNMLDIVQQNITIQTDALAIVKAQKEAAKVTLLAVNRFEAQLLKTNNLLYAIRQNIVETENRLYFLTGKFPGSIQRNVPTFYNISNDAIQAGLPSQLLLNRPDIRQAENELTASRLDIKSARANFYPSFKITGQGGFQAFNPSFLIKPEALVYNLAGELMAPLINRNAIKAVYYNANAKQIQAAYKYEQTILNAHLDVLNELARLDNFSKSYQMKSSEVGIRNESVAIATSLFNSARADYGEVLFTQGEVLDSKMELIEIKLKQIHAKINIYRALGGGWK